MILAGLARRVIGHISARGSGNEVEVAIYVPSDAVDVKEVTDRWRELIGDPGAVEDFHMDYTINERGKPITLVMASPSLEDLREVSDYLREVLESHPGVYNINDSTAVTPRRDRVGHETRRGESFDHAVRPGEAGTTGILWC